MQCQGVVLPSIHVETLFNDSRKEVGRHVIDSFRKNDLGFAGVVQIRAIENRRRTDIRDDQLCRPAVMLFEFDGYDLRLHVQDPVDPLQ